MKFLENSLFAFGCIALPILVWWQPEVTAWQHKAGLPDTFGIPLRWVAPFLALAASGWCHSLNTILCSGRERQTRISVQALLFGLVTIVLAVPCLLSVLAALLFFPFRFVH